jgi:DNA-binding CsgD family transcriptional regulator
MVVAGEPGIGKSALLDYVVQSASGFRLIRTAGVESEMELPFAALQQLCAPMLDLLSDLPEPQSEALRTAFGLTAGPPPDRFLVGLAVLSLLSDAAADGHLLCVIDDAQWLDRASSLALAFVARRLLADPVGLVVSTRQTGGDWVGLPELVLAGLRDEEARTLLRSVPGIARDEAILDRILAETHGNPLAILECYRGMTAAEVATGSLVAAGRPLTRRIEESFRRQLAQLPEATQRFLQVAAAEPVGDLTLVWRAAGSLNIDTNAASAAVEAGLIELGTRILFRHPLIRSAAYRSAVASERRRVHAALAAATDPAVDSDRRAWHRAQAASGPDEQVALELEQSAARARTRGGLAAAGAFLERSVALTADPDHKLERILAAVWAKRDAGEVDGAVRLLAIAEANPVNEFGRARISLLHGSLAFLVGNGSDAPRLLLEAAQQLESHDPRLAREIYIHALAAASTAGIFAHAADRLAVAKAASLAPAPPAAGRPTDLMLTGIARFDCEGPSVAVPALREALHAFRAPDVAADDLNWLLLAVVLPTLLWDPEGWRSLAGQDLQRARDDSALTRLSYALNGLACIHLFYGDLNSAASLLAEAEAHVEATGIRYIPYGAMQLAALRGQEREAAALIEAGVAAATAGGQGIVLPYARSAAATLYNGLGRYDRALVAAREVERYPRHWGSHLTLHELVEAAVRSGVPAQATNAFEWISQTAEASGSDWGLGIKTRCAALLSEGKEAESLYQLSIDHLERVGVRSELARSHLLYGEWLRRQGRRVDAREQLRTAHGMLGAMGMEGFADRARRELLATGETLRKRSVETLSDLTPQEAQIARLAAEGRSNGEIGSQLFVSSRTVEWHLRKIFPKLGVTSRRQLREALPAIASRN